METAIQLYHERTEAVSRSKQYRVMALLAFCVSAGLCAIRLLSYYLPIENDTLSDFVFTVLVQICMLLVMTFLFIKFLLKKNMREVLEFSNCKKTAWFNLALAVPIGMCCYVVTIWVSNLWMNIIINLGYTYTSTPLPEVFSGWEFIAAIVLTGIFPAICEEFFNRGGLLTTIRGSYPMMVTVALMGVEFGLFHQNITQVFYTMLFGVLMSFMTLKCKSLYPAMIVHFMNNTIAVIDEYCYEYGFLNGGFYKIIFAAQDRSPQLLLLLFAVFAAILVGLVILLARLNGNTQLRKKKEVIADSGFDHTNNRVVLIGEEDKDKVRELGMDKEVYGEKLKENLYKATLRDNAFFIGAIVICVFTTIASFIFGFII